MRNQFRIWLLAPPYRGVVWLSWLYVVGCCLLAGGRPFDGRLAWFDDNVRMAQMLDWLNGPGLLPGWYNHTLMRVDPPVGFHTIWSRLPDLPIAAVILSLQPVMGQMQAALAATLLIPLIQALLLFMAASWFVMPLVGKGRARLITLFVLFTCCLNPQPFTLAGFQAGAAGHRAWDILLTLLLFGAAARLLAGCSRSIWLGALAIGGLVALAIEGLPLIACTVLLGVLISQFLHRSVIALRFAALFALGSLFGSLFLLADHPPAAYFTVSFAEPSIIGPLLTGCAALLFTGQYVALRYLHQRRELALFALLAVAAALTAVLIHYFPQMLAGAGAGLSPAERQLAASSHAEAMRLRQVATSLADYLRLITPSLLGLLGIGLAIERSKLLQTDEKLAQRRIPLLLFYGGLTVASFLIASRYARYYPYAELCACPWLLWLWQFFSGRLAAGEWRGVQRTLFYLALGPLPLLVWPAMLVDASFRSNVLLFPTSQQVATDKCEIGPVADWVDRQFSPTALMLVPLNASDRFLFRTQVKLMFLASFPSQDRFIDATTFYDTFDPDAAKAIAKRHRLDAVAICKDYYPLNANSAFEDRLLRGHIRFGRQLATGTVPDWLIPVPIPVDTPYLFFKIDHSRL